MRFASALCVACLVVACDRKAPPTPASASGTPSGEAAPSGLSIPIFVDKDEVGRVHASQVPLDLAASLPSAHRDTAAWKSILAVSEGRKIAIHAPSTKYARHAFRFYQTEGGIGFGVFPEGSDKARMQLDDVAMVTVHTAERKRPPPPTATLVTADGKSTTFDARRFVKLEIVGLPGGRNSGGRADGGVRLNARNRGWHLGRMVTEMAPGDPPKRVVVVGSDGDKEERVSLAWADVGAANQLHHVKRIRRGFSYSHWDLSNAREPKQVRRVRHVLRIELQN